MDFLKKMATDAMSGDERQQQQQGGQGQYGQDNEQGQYGQGNQGDYGNEQGSYGGQQGGYGGQQGGNEYGNTGGEQYNRPHGEGGAGGYSSGGGAPTINENTAINAANEHAANGSENSSLFSTAMGFLGNMNKDDSDVDEDKVQQQHDEAYSQGNAGGMSANAIGSAAAMQALKSFTSGQSGAASSSGGGDMQSKIIGMAMSEAAKLFDQSGGAAQGNKQDAVTSAGQTIMKLLIKSQMSGMMGGGNSGGLSGLMGMASKFM
ncbi:uncharacterized protein IL334_001716 [Kwoniella shivajii]|uniref:DUF7721 domain-containing protein n=1 Tax=Kwoniella shivajii TaxID=564305 RepID=A0ABZ1CWW8_9TREE|nr:hypothetical protein IL334_001716 [Kwoniella shivajii]